MQIALGTTRSKWGLNPPYIDKRPSSAHTILLFQIFLRLLDLIFMKMSKEEMIDTYLNVLISPVYFGGWPGGGVCRNLVLTTSCGYVKHVAVNFASPAAAACPNPSSPHSILFFNCSYNVHWITPSVTPKYEAERPR